MSSNIGLFFIQATFVHAKIPSLRPKGIIHDMIPISHPKNVIIHPRPSLSNLRHRRSMTRRLILHNRLPHQPAIQVRADFNNFAFLIESANPSIRVVELESCVENCQSLAHIEVSSQNTTPKHSPFRHSALITNSTVAHSCSPPPTTFRTAS